MRLLSEAIAAFGEAQADSTKLLDVVARRVAGVVRDTAVVMLSTQSGDLGVAAAYDEDDAVIEDLLASLADAPSSLAREEFLASGKPLLLPQLDLDALAANMSPALHACFRRRGVYGMIVAPMRVRGQSVGLIAVLRHRAFDRALEQLDADLVQDLATHAGLAIANARLTERVRDGDAVRAAREEVMRANRFLDAVIENLPDMVFVKDATRLAFTRFNRAGEQLLGIPRSQLLGKTDYDFFPESEAEFFQKKDRETLKSRTLVDIPEEPIQTVHGQRWLRTKKVPILDEHGEPLYLLGISEDITDRKRTDAELRRAKEQAERVSKELEAFSYSVAHDLRAPLRGIDGFSQALLDDYGDQLDARAKRYLGLVREGAQRMAVLIDDLLALSRVTRQELVMRTVDLSALAQTAVANLQRLDPSRKVEVVIEPDLTARGDARMLAIALDNLFGNAWKFTSKVPDAKIELFATDREGQRAFAVRDNGAGFDMQYVNKLFGVFQRLHTETEFPGTGIGLATVARIIYRHEGQVAAEGAPGKGATFYFTLGAESS
ncbi:MAG: PAS domain-containing protein [Myxococcales bacterium]|nr:PAS domain-containing protein [Myxococcales bacterium]